MRPTIAGLIAVIIGLFTGLVLSRFFVVSIQITVSPVPSTSAAPATSSHARDAPLVSFGDEALKSGQLAQARAHFNKAVMLCPTDHQGYSGLARVASQEGDFDEARHQWRLAIKVAKTAGVAGDVVAFLYRSMALASIAHSRQDEADATTHCRVALADLAKARGAVKGVDSYASYLIEIATAELEQRMSEVAARDGDQKSAVAHHASFEKHVKAAHAMEPALATNRNQPLATSAGMIGGMTARKSDSDSSGRNPSP